MSLGLVGQQLGKYEIVSEIGQGGMSVVYRAKDTQLLRDVAIKVMHSFLAEQPEAKERFHREAVAVARLRHPHIIEIFDYSGEGAALSYIVTELISGGSLAETVRQKRIAPPEAALGVARAIADALTHAHAHGVIHRDLKPENILVGDDGALKLTDFGIARMLDNQTLTITGTLLGSPAYMAPEYINGKDTDERSDIFSFGAMLYQFAVGRLPFEGPTPHALLMRIASGTCMPPEQANPQIHAAIARIIKKCMATDPADRYPTAQAVLTAIDQVLARLGLDELQERKMLFADPEAYSASLRERLVPLYVELGKAALAQKRVGTALEDFDRVLSLAPQHVEVKRLVRKLSQRALTRRIVQKGSTIVGAVALLGVLGAMSISYVQTQRAETARLQAEALAAQPPPENNLAPRNVVLNIRGTGNVYVDGQLVREQVSGGVAIELAPGKRRIRVSGNQTVEEVVTIAETGAVSPIEFDVMGSAKPQATGVLAALQGSDVNAPQPGPDMSGKSKTIWLNPAGRWMEVWVDGKQVFAFIQARQELSLPYGQHVLRFVRPDAQPFERTIMVSDTEPPELEPIALKPLPAQLLIEGAPEGSVVEIAGRRTLLVANEPVRVALDEFKQVQHEVVISKDAKELLRQTSKFGPGERKTLTITAQK